MYGAADNCAQPIWLPGDFKRLGSKSVVRRQPCQHFQRDPPSVVVAGLVEDGYGVPAGANRFLETLHFSKRYAEAVWGEGFVIWVIGLVEDSFSVLVRGDGLVEPPQVLQG